MDLTWSICICQLNLRTVRIMNISVYALNILDNKQSSRLSGQINDRGKNKRD